MSHLQEADSGISNRLSTNISMHFNTMSPTVIRAKHWLRPHSDECPGLPCRDVPPSQTPSSHHAPVTVAAYSRAHRPQGPGQGGLPSHINISFHNWRETCASSFESLSVAPCCCPCSPGLWTGRAEIPSCLKAWNEHIIVSKRPAVPAVNAHYVHWCCAVFNFSSCWSLLAKTVQGSERWWRRPLRVSPTRGSSGLTR